MKSIRRNSIPDIEFFFHETVASGKSQPKPFGGAVVIIQRDHRREVIIRRSGANPFSSIIKKSSVLVSPSAKKTEMVTHTQPELMTTQCFVIVPVRLRLLESPHLAETMEIGDLEIEVVVSLKHVLLSVILVMANISLSKICCGNIQSNQKTKVILTG